MIRNRSIVALLSAELVSRLGSQLTTLALPWFVLVTTHSSSRMGLVSGYVVAGTLFAAIGLHTTYALMAAVGTFATLNFVVAVLPLVGAPVAQEAA